LERKTGKCNVFYNYRDDKQDLSVTPASYFQNLQTHSANSDLVHQYLNLKTFETIHSASLVFLKIVGLLHQKLGLIILTNKLITDTYGETNGEFRILE
jgi:hypothetical protein